MIGDPSGKSKERNLQTKEKLAENTESIRHQLERFLDLRDPNKGILVNNYDWLGHMETLDFLRDYGKYFPINYMLSKEIVASRLEAGISFTEFSYQILQSIDFYHLHHAYNCEIQIGGNDQWGNLTSGLELIRKLDGENEPVEAMVHELTGRGASAGETHTVNQVVEAALQDAEEGKTGDGRVFLRQDEEATELTLVDAV